MNAVRAADGRRLLVLVGAALQRRKQGVDVGDEDVAGALQLHGQAGVEHVGTGHALMHEARIGADEFGEVRQEGDDVVLYDALDLVDARDVENDAPRLLPNGFGARLGDDANLGERVAGVRLDLEPDFEARLRRPDRDHLGTGITGDHRRRVRWEKAGTGL